MADNTVAKKGFFARLKSGFKGVISEMKKVTWPTKQETSKYTLVVLVVCAAFALLFWLVDTGILSLLGLIVK